QRKINVFIVDDKLPRVLSDLEDVKEHGFEFKGTTNFNCESVFEAIKDCTILLLDIEDGEDRDAGIKLFHKLCEDDTWKEKEGSVQIVFFSNTDTVANLYKLVKSKKKAERFYLSGYLGKRELYDCNDEAIDVLRMADSNAKHYKEYPNLADPIINACELLHHPNNKTMKKLIERAYLAGKCQETVLILGETGTGKELLAKFIYEVMQSENREKICLRGCDGLLNCNIGAVPTEGNLQYIELFGALKESFNGCTEDRMGIFEKASKEITMGNIIDRKNGCTIFLDEIGEAHKTVQVALLRAIQENEIIPVGGFATNKENVEIPVKFRLIAATNVDIHEKIKSNEFRLDLYHRISTIEIRIPPLRERKEDIPLLVFHFVNKLNGINEYNKSVGNEKYITENGIRKFMEKFKDYDWPGNVRELEKVIRYLYVMSLGTELDINNINDISDNMISGSATASTLTSEQIYDDLKKNPCALPKLKKDHLITNLVKVVELFISEHGALSDKNDNKSRAIFTQKSTTVRGWYNENKKKIEKTFQ
ncbi:MAG: sigma-54-dependent Fis family transcriptional regulator, partial [Candidatus Brocadiales bacterium]|nr:sigma-54-dependent Fis family transcriptional regulator [Candidatus Brocadiales bacterium]